jgi:hypothetical protein
MQPETEPQRAPPTQILLRFLRLGLTGFGGPIAHLGYFRTEFLEHRRRLSDQADAEPAGKPALPVRVSALPSRLWWGALRIDAP